LRSRDEDEPLVATLNLASIRICGEVEHGKDHLREDFCPRLLDFRAFATLSRR